MSSSRIAFSIVLFGGPGILPLTLSVPADPTLADQFVFFQGAAVEPGFATPSFTNLGDTRIR